VLNKYRSHINELILHRRLLTETCRNYTVLLQTDAEA